MCCLQFAHSRLLYVTLYVLVCCSPARLLDKPMDLINITELYTVYIYLRAYVESQRECLMCVTHSGKYVEEYELHL